MRFFILFRHFGHLFALQRCLFFGLSYILIKVLSSIDCAFETHIKLAEIAVGPGHGILKLNFFFLGHPTMELIYIQALIIIECLWIIIIKAQVIKCSKTSIHIVKSILFNTTLLVSFMSLTLGVFGED